MPATTFEHTARVAIPPEVVLSRLEDASTWSGIGPIDDVSDAVADEGGRLSSFRWSARAAGRTWQGTAVRASSTAGQFRLSLDSPEVGGEISVTAAADGEKGSRITVALDARSKGMLAGMFWGVISDAIGSGLPRQVDEFAAGLASEGS